METTNLASTKMKDLVQCLLKAFEHYFVPMPQDLDYWQKRFYHARVHLPLSYGVTANNELVGFIINAIDDNHGKKTAYNTGTGILDHHRGQQLVDRMYSYSIPLLKEKGVEQCQLEVIDKNYRAIKVYERIGFQKTKTLMSYKGNLNSSFPVRVKSLPLEKIQELNSYDDYAWDFTNTTVLMAKKYYQLFEVVGEKKMEHIGHFVINPHNGTVAQLECMDDQWEALFNGISWASKTIKINNIDDRRTNLISYLNKIELPNVINQFEMEMKI